MKTRNGVLGLDTAKEVMITFLVLSTIGISILLALTSLQTATTSTVDTSTIAISVTNETGASANTTDYTLSGYNSSWSGITLTSLWNATDGGAGSYNLSLGLGNASLSSVGVLTNGTTTEYEDVSVSYYYTYTYNNGRTASITGNVSSGVVTFFASTGTVFSILIVVVIILAISIIIWAVGRFGSQMETEATDL